MKVELKAAGNLHVHIMCTLNFQWKNALTTSPSPIGWERVAARPGEGRPI